MKLLLLILLLTILNIICGRPQNYATPESPSEVKAALSRSFGLRKDYQNLNLPAIPSSDQYTFKHPYNFNLTNDGSGNYYFGYNTFEDTDRYEIGELKNPGTDNEIQSVRGQYIDRYFTSDGDVIVRTIGYIADENGYQPFLIDIHVETEPEILEHEVVSAPVPGGPKGEKTGISSAAQATLIGGGLGK